MNKVLISLIAGFAIGVMLAPDKGSVTRKKISDAFDDLSDKLSNLMDEFTPEDSRLADAARRVPKMGRAI